jgi:hypothetical protein
LTKSFSIRATFLGRVGSFFDLVSIISAAALASMAVISLFRAIPPDGSSGVDLLTYALMACQLVARVALILLALTWLVWMFQASRFIKLASPDKLQYGPYSAVALHFIPVIGQAMPMIIMTELERRTRNPERWRELDTRHLPATAWLIGFLSTVLFSTGWQIITDVWSHTARVAGHLLVVLGAAGIIASLVMFNRYIKHMASLQAMLAAKLDARNAAV